MNNFVEWCQKNKKSSNRINFSNFDFMPSAVFLLEGKENLDKFRNIVLLGMEEKAAGRDGWDSSFQGRIRVVNQYNQRIIFFEDPNDALIFRLSF